MNAPRRHPLANADIEREARYYSARQLRLGTEFVDEVKHVIDVIAANPLRHSIRFGNWRRANLRRFPGKRGQERLPQSRTALPLPACR